jgi:hypothetical protein
MAVVSLKNKLRRGNLLVGNDAYDPSATWLIQRINGDGSSASITFSSIPSGYTSLQIRGIARGTRSYIYEALYVRLNGDSGNNYAYHNLYGDDGGIGPASGTTTNVMLIGQMPAATVTNNCHTGFVVDLHDYTSTTRNKTLRAFDGFSSNQTGAGYSFIYLSSGLWMNTNAVTSVTILSNGAFTADSTFALYGMKG